MERKEAGDLATGEAGERRAGEPDGYRACQSGAGASEDGGGGGGRTADWTSQGQSGHMGPAQIGGQVPDRRQHVMKLLLFF